ncbi:DoxX family protein [Rhodohalobacter sulfatireducens]|uniref:DoxX family protein n=1 Tax=Rhodohalobacter sulfatireducens TaxID=2911366 RepID=A0ABS9KGW0_9BACT|nr:DoxX family protein [Rhodohalobacter sulfatireducens]MCG2590099.1 DoxX family protein [Rhodohalobacter sulfatireducens]
MFKKLNSTQLNTIVSPDLAILLLRIGTVCLVLTHGIPKLIKIITGDFTFGDPLGLGPTVSLLLATFAEVICAIFVLIGFWTRLATIPLIFTFIVIVFIVYAGDPFGDKELPLLFLISFLTLFLTGSGKYSIDEISLPST